MSDRVIAFLLSATLLQAGSVFAQTPQTRPAVTDAEIVNALRSTDAAQKLAVVARAAQLPPHTLSEATISLLAQELTTVTDQPLVQPTDRINEGQGEFIAQLIQTLAHQEQPTAIDALAEVAETGRVAQNALLKFGDAAVPALVRVGRQESPYYGKMAAALDTLEEMLEKPSGPPLSLSSRALVRSLASERLANAGQRFKLLASAACLAVATGDPDLRQQAARLVDNRAEFNRMGLTNPGYQDFVSERVRQALAKFPQP